MDKANEIDKNSDPKYKHHMKAQAFIMDTFTSVPFSGNPTGVICSEDGLKPDVMLSVAREFNYPVTAFIKKEPAPITLTIYDILHRKQRFPLADMPHWLPLRR